MLQAQFLFLVSQFILHATAAGTKGPAAGNLSPASVDSNINTTVTATQPVNLQQYQVMEQQPQPTTTSNQLITTMVPLQSTITTLVPQTIIATPSIQTVAFGPQAMDNNTIQPNTLILTQQM